MSRPIKYKFFYKPEQRFISLWGAGWRFDPENGQIYSGDMNITERFEIVQYTGLKDCNGTEIYAGYVIQMDCGCDSEYGCSHGPWHGYVKWDPETASYELRDMDGRWSGEAFEENMTDEYLVVGNIYETPLEDTP